MRVRCQPAAPCSHGLFHPSRSCTPNRHPLKPRQRGESSERPRRKRRIRTSTLPRCGPCGEVSQGRQPIAGSNSGWPLPAPTNSALTKPTPATRYHSAVAFCACDCDKENAGVRSVCMCTDGGNEQTNNATRHYSFKAFRLCVMAPFMLFGNGFMPRTRCQNPFASTTYVEVTDAAFWPGPAIRDSN